MSCRARRGIPTEPPLGPVTCSDCGARPLDVFYSSKTENCHLCAICFQARSQRDVMRSPEPAGTGPERA